MELPGLDRPSPEVSWGKPQLMTHTPDSDHDPPADPPEEKKKLEKN